MVHPKLFIVSSQCDEAIPPPPQFLCAICNTSFVCKDYLIKHMRTCHQIVRSAH